MKDGGLPRIAVEPVGEAARAPEARTPTANTKADKAIRRNKEGRKTRDERAWVAIFKMGTSWLSGGERKAKAGAYLENAPQDYTQITSSIIGNNGLIACDNSPRSR